MKVFLVVALVFTLGFTAQAGALEGEYVSADDASYIVNIVDSSTLLLKENMGLGLPPEIFKKRNGVWELNISERSKSLGYSTSRTIEFVGEYKMIMEGTSLDDVPVSVVYTKRKEK